jgi:hypothetical protein
MSALVATTPGRTAGKLGSWLATRHSLRAEAALVLVLYGVYELARGLVVGDASEAVRHARELVELERSLHVFVEGGVQDAAQALPGVLDVLGAAYLTLHLAGTAAVLLWLHQRRPGCFAFVRTTLMLASGLALLGYLVYPTAPPRLAEIGIADTVSSSHIDLNSGLVSALYNPYAAIPSMHVGYALVVGVSLLRYGRRRPVRAIGAVYPIIVLLVVVATGNHFVMDAMAGVAVIAVAAGAARLLAGTGAASCVTRLPDRRVPAWVPEQLAA